MSSSMVLDGHRSIPIMPSDTSPRTAPRMEVQADSMDITTPPPTSARMGPPATCSPEMDHEMQGNKTTGNGVSSNHNNTQNETPATTTNGNSNNNTFSAAAAATSSGPKVVQTAFIHKLYNMLEDQTIRHLISWSSSNESFVMSPSPDFSKVLAQYFKHTNISSFVRQLNMYGFHKVSDVFHTGAPESALWEFKHGQGNFKRGDLNGLREIKRRASRHTLIHRSESFSSPHKPSVSQPGTPAEPIQEPSGDPRLAHIEQSLYETHARLARTEESNTALSSKCAMLSENLARCQQWNSDLTKVVMRMINDQDNPLYRDLSQMQKDITKQQELFRSLDDPHESLISGRQPYFHSMAIDQPLSPRQAAQDEQRRPSLHGMPPRPANMFRAPPHITGSPRRYGSIGNNSHQPSFQRPSISAQPPAPPPQHPLAYVTEPGSNLARRHTSADIRDTAGWPPQPSESQSHTPQWPPSPQAPVNPSDQHVRDVLASYELGAPRRQPASRSASRAASPPAPHTSEAPGGPMENGWGFNSNKLVPRVMDSAPQTRRSSMASNVHNLLNPAETAEREEDEFAEDRKRKRLA